MENILVIGATSEIAKATARLYAQNSSNLYLLARDTRILEITAKDLEICGASQVNYGFIEITDFATHPSVIDQAFKQLKHIDVVLIAHGTLPDQALCENNVADVIRELNVNAIGTISVLTHLANKFEEQGSGTIAVITSVAGERGRKKNYVYGSAKGMISIFLQGLRNRLFAKGITVLDIKPGLVDTPMTNHMKKTILWTQPETIAKSIVKGINKNKNIIYCPFYWRFIMIILKLIPENIFKKLNI